MNSHPKSMHLIQCASLDSACRLQLLGIQSFPTSYEMMQSIHTCMCVCVFVVIFVVFLKFLSCVFLIDFVFQREIPKGKGIFNFSFVSPQNRTG